jgi:hypothetical protein
MVRDPARARRDVTPGGSAPLIVTGTLPADLQSWANALRQAHFPPERNHLQAHVTLFHALPPFAEDEVRELLARLAAEFAPPRAQLSAIMALGGGTALRIDSAALLAVRALIADRFHGQLSAQDDQRPRLHVTVQNKVSGQEAKALQAELAVTFAPRDFAFAGLALHAYRGGPWDTLGTWRFRGRTAAA